MQGLLLLNKPAGVTSFGVVSRIKKLAGEKRVGHTGTLDPMATGVLPVFIGRSTVLSSFLLEADKSYTARIRLGIRTETDDITGAVLEEKPVDITSDGLKELLSRFIGRQSQIPPMYSALKKDGVRLYSLARQGKTVDIPSREIEVYSLDLLEDLNSENEILVSAVVSKGTYIRSLARDIGEAAGCGATLTGLCRTKTSGFGLDKCIEISELTSENIGDYILNPEIAVERFREISVTEKQAIRFSNGGQLSFERLNIRNIGENELFRVKYKDTLLGLGFADLEKGEIGIKCVINAYT